MVGGFAPVVFVPGTLVLVHLCRPIAWKLVGVSKQTYGFVPQANVSELDGCPRFASAYLGRKWFFRMLSLEGVTEPRYGYQSCGGGLRPRRFRPRYAGANLGHPCDFLKPGGRVQL